MALSATIFSRIRTSARFGKAILNKNVLVMLSMFVYLTVQLAACTRSVQPVQTTPVRIGWQTTWATQGQIVQVLKRTNVLELYGFAPEFVGVSYGGPLNEAAVAGQVDAIFTADQPATALLARDPDWKIISRLMFNRVALYVPPDSPIQSIADLKGKTIAMPFGAAAQREALRVIQAAGLDPVKDVKIVNLDITEQASVVDSGSSSHWRTVDAMAGFDPTAALFQVTGKARMLHTGEVIALVLMSEDYIKKYPDAPVRFLQAFIEAYFYYASHQDQANDWFIQDSQLTFDAQILDLAASVEPNLRAIDISEIDLDLSSYLIGRLQEAADFVFEQGLIRHDVTMSDHIDLTYLQRATHLLRPSEYSSEHIQVR